MKTATSNESLSPEPVSGFRKLLRNLGPALIVATVVVGPGSILVSSTVGTDFGYSMVWVLMLACLLMLGMTALSARLGGSLEGSICDEIRERSGPFLAILAGFSVFLVTTCFQFGNNVGVLAAMEPLADLGKGTKVGIIVLLNALIIGVLFGFKNLYKPLERIMMVLIGLMLLGFAGNLLLAQPSLIETIKGLWPNLPSGVTDDVLPRRAEGGGIADSLLPVQALLGTTLSIAGAFYVSYLVKEKGWKAEDWKKGFTDSAIGIVLLGVISLMIMVTAASVLHGVIVPGELKTAADVARQLEPLFGKGAVILFSFGLFAGAFSSFLVNSLIGGTLLSDGLNLGSHMDGRWPRIFTVVGLLIGMIVALAAELIDLNPVSLVVFGQSLTVLGNPVLAGVLFWLAVTPGRNGQPPAPLWMRIASGVAFVVVVFLAIRTAVRLYLTVFGG